MTAAMECGGSTPLLQFKPYSAFCDCHDRPIAAVMAQHAAPVRSVRTFNFQFSTIN
jgi:hypothetical protein